MRQPPGNDLDLGNLFFPRTVRDKHLYICGGTGTGKSRFLEYLIQQDVWNWRESRCGMLVLDPCGNLYDNLINWLAKSGIDRPIIPIDLRQDDWIVSYNLLRQRDTVDPSVLIDNLIDAMAYVWGETGTDRTPQLAQWAGNVLTALYEKKFTLVEAEHLFDRVATQVRSAMTSDLKDLQARQDWQMAGTLNAKDFDAQIGSTVRRFRRFIKNQTIRSIFGQPSVSLDLGRALEEGSIILVSLATQDGKISKENARLFATLLLSDLWTASQERGKREGVKPFYVYVDEFQKFITPTIAENLDEARGYGLHLTMAHQFPMQLADEGMAGKKVYNSVMESASSKVVFRLADRQNLEPLADWLFMGTMNPDEIKHELYTTKVLKYREEIKEVHSESATSAAGYVIQGGHVSGSASGATEMFTGNHPFEISNPRSESQSNFNSESGNTSESGLDSTTTSKSLVPTIVPVIGKELAHIERRPLEEQRFRARSAIFLLEERYAIARLAGMTAPTLLHTPTIELPPHNPARVNRYLDRCYKKLPFALLGVEVKRQIGERADNFVKELLQGQAKEPVTAKRKIR